MLEQAAKEWREASSIIGFNSTTSSGNKKRKVARKSLPVLPTRVLPVRTARQRLNSTGSSNRSSVEEFTPRLFPVPSKYFYQMTCNKVLYSIIIYRKSLVYDEDLLNEDDMVAAKKRKKRIATWRVTVDALTVDNITDEMLENVCDQVSEKIYDGVCFS